MLCVFTADIYTGAVEQRSVESAHLELGGTTGAVGAGGAGGGALQP